MSSGSNDNGRFQSVDWDLLSEKRDWSSVAWTVAAVLIILIGFCGGMVARTSLIDEPGGLEQTVPAVRNTDGGRDTSGDPAASQGRSSARIGTTAG